RRPRRSPPGAASEMPPLGDPGTRFSTSETPGSGGVLAEARPAAGGDAPNRRPALPAGIGTRSLTTTEKQPLFEGHALFGTLSADDIDALLLRARFEHCPAGHLVFAKGSPGRSMMAVLGGSIRIAATAPNGREVVLAILNAGEIFGEMALL